MDSKTEIRRAKIGNINKYHNITDKYYINTAEINCPGQG